MVQFPAVPQSRELGAMHLDTGAFPPVEGLPSLGLFLRWAYIWSNSQCLGSAGNVPFFPQLLKISQPKMAWATISLMPCGFSVKAFLADSAVCLQKLFLDFFLKLPPIMEAKNSNTEFPSLPWARCGHVTWLQPMIRRSLPGVSGGKNCVCVCVKQVESSLISLFLFFLSGM